VAWGIAIGGVMRFRRALVIPAILALGVAGSALAGSAMPMAAAHPAVVHVHIASGSATPNTLYRV
jgi:hypothetical protein